MEEAERRFIAYQFVRVNGLKLTANVFKKDGRYYAETGEFRGYGFTLGGALQELEEELRRRFAEDPLLLPPFH